jgi:hypothetical protein
MKRLIANLLLGQLLCFATVAQGIVVPDLYQVSVSAASREEPFAKALEAVLTKLTARHDFANESLVLEALENSQSYVQQYSTHNHDLWAQMDPDLLGQLLKKAKLPFLGENRPLALLWVAVEDNNGHRTIVDSAQSDFLEILESLNKRYGQLVALPLMDLEDVSNISVTDFHLNSTYRFSEATTRYGAEVWTTLMLEEQPDGSWEAQWLVKTPLRAREFNAKNQNMFSLFKTCMATLSQIIVEDYGVAHGYRQEGVKIQVSEVDSFEEFNNLVRYLNELDAVKKTVVIDVDSNNVALIIDTLGGEAAFMQAVRLDHRLIANGPQQYQWIP